MVRIQLPRFNGKLAQSVEHMTHIHKVASSNLALASYDIKIEIISYLGRWNGEAWWLVKGPDGGRTGVPESQISFYNKL